MLNLAHARTFLTVIETGGLRAAARRLDISAATVVDHLNQLEAELAAALLLRRRPKVELTPQGQAFMPLARALITTAERARRIVADAPVRIAAASNIGAYMLPPIIAEIERSWGNRIEMWIGSNPDVADRLETGAADITAMEWWDNRPGFAARPWRRERLCVIVAPEHHWAGRKEIAAEELADEPMLGGERASGTGGLLRERLGPVFGSLKLISGFGSTEAVKRGVRAGLGVSVVLEISVADEIAAGALVAIPIAGGELVKQLWLVAPSGLPESAPASRLLSALARSARVPVDVGAAVRA